MAAEQARSELMQGWVADSGGAASTSGRAEATQPASLEAVCAFLLEQGLNSRDAERLAATLLSPSPSSSGDSSASSSGGGGGSGFLSLAQLQAKWTGLQRVIPDANLAEMVRWFLCGIAVWLVRSGNHLVCRIAAATAL